MVNKSRRRGKRSMKKEPKEKEILHKAERIEGHSDEPRVDCSDRDMDHAVVRDGAEEPPVFCAEGSCGAEDGNDNGSDDAGASQEDDIPAASPIHEEAVTVGRREKLEWTVLAFVILLHACGAFLWGVISTSSSVTTTQFQVALSSPSARSRAARLSVLAREMTEGVPTAPTHPRSAGRMEKAMAPSREDEQPRHDVTTEFQVALSSPPPRSRSTRSLALVRKTAEEVPTPPVHHRSTAPKEKAIAPPPRFEELQEDGRTSQSPNLLTFVLADFARSTPDKDAGKPRMERPTTTAATSKTITTPDVTAAKPAGSSGSALDRAVADHRIPTTEEKAYPPSSSCSARRWVAEYIVEEAVCLATAKGTEMGIPIVDVGHFGQAKTDETARASSSEEASSVLSNKSTNGKEHPARDLVSSSCSSYSLCSSCSSSSSSSLSSSNRDACFACFLRRLERCDDNPAARAVPEQVSHRGEKQTVEDGKVPYHPACEDEMKNVSDVGEAANAKEEQQQQRQRQGQQQRLGQQLQQEDMELPLAVAKPLLTSTGEQDVSFTSHSSSDVNIEESASLVQETGLEVVREIPAGVGEDGGVVQGTVTEESTVPSVALVLEMLRELRSSEPPMLTQTRMGSEKDGTTNVDNEHDPKGRRGFGTFFTNLLDLRDKHRSRFEELVDGPWV